MANEPTSIRLLASFYEEGAEGLPRDDREAVRWLGRGVELNDPACISHLAVLVRDGRAGPKDLTRSTALFERAADLGYLSAIKNLALCYEQGIGVPIDWARAMSWYERYFAVTAVDDDFPRPHAASMLRAGAPGLPKDVARAVTLLEESAGAGCVEAMVALALMRRDGVDVPRDLARARALLEEAVRRGHAEAVNLLAALPPD